MSAEVHEIHEPWGQVEEARGTTVVFSGFTQIHFSTCVHLDTLWMLWCSAPLSKSSGQWRLLTRLVCALQQRLLWWTRCCCSTHIVRNGHSPIWAVFCIFPPAKALLLQSWSSDFCVPYCKWADGEAGSKWLVYVRSSLQGTPNTIGKWDKPGSLKPALNSTVTFCVLNVVSKRIIYS